MKATDLGEFEWLVKGRTTPCCRRYAITARLWLVGLRVGSPFVVECTVCGATRDEVVR